MFGLYLIERPIPRWLISPKALTCVIYHVKYRFNIDDFWIIVYILMSVSFLHFLKECLLAKALPVFIAFVTMCHCTFDNEHKEAWIYVLHPIYHHRCLFLGTSDCQTVGFYKGGHCASPRWLSQIIGITAGRGCHWLILPPSTLSCWDSQGQGVNLIS